MRLAKLWVGLDSRAHALQHGVYGVAHRRLEVARVEVARGEGSTQLRRSLKHEVAPILLLALDDKPSLAAEGQHHLLDDREHRILRHVAGLAKGFLHLALHVGLRVEE